MAGTSRQLDRAAEALVATLFPAERERHIDGTLQAIDEAGRPNREYFRSIIPPQVLSWPTGDTGKFVATARAGRSVLAMARAGTAPSTGACIITLSWETATQGLTTIGEVRIPNGQRFGQSGETEIGVELPAGAWVRAQVTAANGASNVSAALVIERI